MTKTSGIILKFIRDAAVPVSAADILDAKILNCDTATIYRNLKSLEKNGLVTSFPFECDHRGTERYFSLSGSTHSHYFHCETCHKFYDVGPCILGKALEKIQNTTGFKIKNHILSLSGVCSLCAKSAK